MHPAARMGYLYLLSSSWQTEDCTISADPIDLATESGLGDELWAMYGGRILRNFTSVDGRYRNAVLFEEWQRAKKEFEKNHGPKLTAEELSEAKRIAGMAGAKARWQKHGKVPSKSWQTNSKSMANDGLQEQVQVQKDKVPSRDKREGNPMHSVFKGLVEDAWKEWGNPLDMPWDGAEGKQLGMLIGANPKLGPDGMRRLLQYRARSTGVNLAERPSKWIRSLTDYARGPLNEFKQPQETSNGTFKGKTESSLDAARRAIEEIEGNRFAGEVGSEETGEADHGGLPGFRGRPDGLRADGHSIGPGVTVLAPS